MVEVANVVWCTGYRPALDWVHLDAFDKDGQPVHDRGVAAEPGLYFIGLFFLSLSRLVTGRWGRSRCRVHRSTHRGPRSQRITGLSAKLTPGPISSKT